MKIALRVDASSQIGTGHFMRCLTLASALKQHEADIFFISRNLPSHLHAMLSEKKIDLISLDNDSTPTTFDDLAHSHWLGMSQRQDAQATLHALSGQMTDWLVVDHYGLDSRWEKIMRQSATQIMVIDDLADRQHDCDILLDQNYYSDMETRYIGKIPKSCHLLLGPRYALLRDDFRKLRNHVKPRTGPIKQVLIFFGGVDADNYTGQAVEALSKLNLVGLSVDVVIGTQHPCLEQIKKSCMQHGYICHVQTNKMAELMATADLAIGAGGSASWERCCLGLPTVLIALADNQINIAKALDEANAGIYVGKFNIVGIPIIRDAITRLLRKKDQIKMLSKKAYLLVDGMGVDRVCQEMGF
jgi:UDP-2,4-diacetamido-2,4,6-trideoxy-beta-L-altropyranose hydrolase